MTGTDSSHILSTADDLKVEKYGNIKTVEQWPSAITSTTDSYLVILKSDSEGINQEQRTKHITSVQKLCSDKNDSHSGIEIGPKDLEQLFPAYMGIFPADIIDTIRKAPEVKSVTRNATVTPSSYLNWWQSMPTIRPDEYSKISQNSNLLWTAKFNSRGANANIFVLDCEGFAADDFQATPQRVQMETMAAHETSHCSRVANCAAGDSVGLAIDAFINPFAREKTIFYFLKIMNWICTFQTEFRVRNNGKTPLSILNCSWELTPRADELIFDEAVNKLHSAGVAVMKAAGNDSSSLDDVDAQVPQLAQMKWKVVGSVDKNRHLAQHSNFGQRVTLFAPGENIKCDPGSDKTYSGTSYATAFVTGYAACLATDYHLTKPDDIYQMIDSLKIWSDSYMAVLPGTGELGPSRRLEIIGPSQCARDLIFWPLTLLTGKKAPNGVDAGNKPIYKTDGFTVTNKNLWSARAPTAETGFSNKSAPIATAGLSDLATQLKNNSATLTATWEKIFGAGTFKVANTIGDVYVGTKRLALSTMSKKGVVKENYLEIGKFILAQMDAATKEKMGN